MYFESFQCVLVECCSENDGVLNFDLFKNGKI